MLMRLRLRVGSDSYLLAYPYLVKNSNTFAASTSAPSPFHEMMRFRLRNTVQKNYRYHMTFKIFVRTYYLLPVIRTVPVDNSVAEPVHFCPAPAPAPAPACQKFRLRLRQFPPYN
jgi:hypothetical protein